MPMSNKGLYFKVDFMDVATVIILSDGKEIPLTLTVCAKDENGELQPLEDNAITFEQPQDDYEMHAAQMYLVLSS